MDGSHKKCSIPKEIKISIYNPSVQLHNYILEDKGNYSQVLKKDKNGKEHATFEKNSLLGDDEYPCKKILSEVYPNGTKTKDITLTFKDKNSNALSVNYYDCSSSDPIATQSLTGETKSFTTYTYNDTNGGYLNDPGIRFIGWSTTDPSTVSNVSASEIIYTSDSRIKEAFDSGEVDLYAVFAPNAYDITLVNYLQSNMKDASGNNYSLSNTSEALNGASTFFQIYATGLSLCTINSSSTDVDEFTGIENVASVVKTPYFTTKVWSVNGMVDWTEVYEFKGYYTAPNGQGEMVIGPDDDGDGYAEIITNWFDGSNGEYTRLTSNGTYIYSYFQPKYSNVITYDGQVDDTVNTNISYGDTIEVNKNIP